MRRYGLSRARVLRILHMPKRVEEGIAPNTMAAMQPVTESRDKKGEVSWKQELWVMVQDKPRERTIISAWRYPGMTKHRSAVAMTVFRQEYTEYLARAVSDLTEKDARRPKVALAPKWRRPTGFGKKKWPSRPLRKGPAISNVIVLD